MTFKEYFNLWEAKQRLDPKCWTGYRKDGTKMKGGKRVNNCVKEDVITEAYKLSSSFLDLPLTAPHGFYILKDGRFIVIPRKEGHDEALLELFPDAMRGTSSELSRSGVALKLGLMRVGKYGSSYEITYNPFYMTGTAAKKTAKDLAIHYKMDIIDSFETVRESVNNVDPDLNELISKFTNEVLSQYTFKTTGKGHLNCAWVTQAFCKFSEQNGKPCKAIMFVWPTEEVVKKLKANGTLPPYYEGQGMSHIAPVVDDTIIDFAIGQFYPQEEIRLTPLDKWQGVYGEFGYGTNEIKGITHLVGSYEEIETWVKSVSDDGAGMNPVAPPLKGKLSERVNNYVKENFADGKNPEHKGDSKRYGVPTKSSVSNLRKVAKQGGRKGQLAHWMANMKAGKAKKK